MGKPKNPNWGYFGNRSRLPFNQGGSFSNGKKGIPRELLEKKTETAITYEILKQAKKIKT